MASVFVSPKAVEDLDDIKNYIEIELKSPKAARKTVLDIIGAYEQLATFPEMGTLLKTAKKALCCYRLLKANEYIVFYRIENDKVYIVRILHRLTDFLKILEV